MRHHRIVKKTTKILIATTVLCLIFNVAAVCLTKALVKPEVSKAQASACDDPQVTVSSSYDISGILTTRQQPKTDSPYNYTVTVRPPSGASDVKTGSARGQEVTTSYKMGDYGNYSVTLNITPSGSLLCRALAPNTQTILYNSVAPSGDTGDSVVTLGQINLSVDKTSIKFGQSVTVTYTFTNHDGQYYSLTAGDSDNDPIFKHDHDQIPSSGTGTYSWSPQEDPGSTDQVRTIAVYTYPTADSESSNDSAFANIVLIGSSSSTQSDGSSSGNSSSTSDNTSSTQQTQNNFTDSLNGNYEAPGDTSGNDNISVKGQLINFIMPNRITSIGTAATAIIALMIYLVGVFGLIGIVYGGIMYVTSAGDQSKVEKAKKTLTYAAIGIVLATFSFIIVRIAGHFWGASL